MSRYTRCITFFSCLITLALVVWPSFAKITANDLPPLKNGDLVFQTVKSSQTTAIMLASNTLYSHIGIIKIDAQGKALVVEAIGPVREIPLDRWIKQGLEGKIAIKRVRGLSDKDAANILDAARRYYGTPYDFFFLFGTDKIYCSELVYYAFKNGAQLALGEIEKVSDLHINNIAVQTLIAQRWKSHPICQKETQSFDACYQIILQQTLITPESIAKDHRLKTLFSNY